MLSGYVTSIVLYLTSLLATSIDPLSTGRRFGVAAQGMKIRDRIYSGGDESRVVLLARVVLTLRVMKAPHVQVLP